MKWPGPFRTTQEIVTANKARGSHYFDRKTMQFFNSIVAPGVIAGRIFITSERFDQIMPRLYTVRIAYNNGSIDTLSEFQQFATLKEAREWAKHYGQLQLESSKEK